MARRKKLQYIENASSRRVTYKKRVRGIVKKTEEISVLCGVDACCIVYGPSEHVPTVWPSTDSEIRRIIEDFKRKPEFDQSQRRFDQLEFLRQSVMKAEERLMKIQRKNREIEMENVVSELLNGKPIEQVPFLDLRDLCWVIQDKLMSIQHRIRFVKGEFHPPNNGGHEIMNMGQGLNPSNNDDHEIMNMRQGLHPPNNGGHEIMNLGQGLNPPNNDGHEIMNMRQGLYPPNNNGHEIMNMRQGLYPPNNNGHEILNMGQELHPPNNRGHEILNMGQVLYHPWHLQAGPSKINTP